MLLKKMESSTSRVIWSLVGLFIAGIMYFPCINAIDNMHGHTTRASFYLFIFIIGLMISWMSVTTPDFKAPAQKVEKQAKIETVKQDDKTINTLLFCGIFSIILAISFTFFPEFSFSSFGFLLIVLIVVGIVLIVFALSQKKKTAGVGTFSKFATFSKSATSNKSMKSSTKSAKSSEKKSGMAIASFVLGFTAFIPAIGIILGIIAIVFGAISLSKISKEGLSGKWMAITGIILGALGILGFIVITFGYLSAVGSAV